MSEDDLPGPIFNLATVTGTTPSSTLVSPITATHTLSVTIRPNLGVTKTSSASSVTIGDTVYYTVTVRNTGDVTLTDVILRDPKLAWVENLGKLAVGETMVMTSHYGPVAETDLPGPILNTASVTGTTPVGTQIGPISATNVVTADDLAGTGAYQERHCWLGDDG